MYSTLHFINTLSFFYLLFLILHSLPLQQNGPVWCPLQHISSGEIRLEFKKSDTLRGNVCTCAACICISLIVSPTLFLSLPLSSFYVFLPSFFLNFLSLSHLIVSLFLSLSFFIMITGQ